MNMRIALILAVFVVFGVVGVVVPRAEISAETAGQLTNILPGVDSTNGQTYIIEMTNTTTQTANYVIALTENQVNTFLSGSVMPSATVSVTVNDDAPLFLMGYAQVFSDRPLTVVGRVILFNENELSIDALPSGLTTTYLTPYVKNDFTVSEGMIHNITTAPVDVAISYEGVDCDAQRTIAGESHITLPSIINPCLPTNYAGNVMVTALDPSRANEIVAALFRSTRTDTSSSYFRDGYFVGRAMPIPLAVGLQTQATQAQVDSQPAGGLLLVLLAITATVCGRKVLLGTRPL